MAAYPAFSACRHTGRCSQNRGAKTATLSAMRQARWSRRRSSGVISRTRVFMYPVAVRNASPRQQYLLSRHFLAPVPLLPHTHPVLGRTDTDQPPPAPPSCPASPRLPTDRSPALCCGEPGCTVRERRMPTKIKHAAKEQVRQPMWPTVAGGRTRLRSSRLVKETQTA